MAGLELRNPYGPTFAGWEALLQATWLSGSSDGVARVYADVLRVEGRHDVLFEDARRFERVANAVLRPIALYPNLAVDDVQMNVIEVDALAGALPASGDNQIPVPFCVINRFVYDIRVRKLDVRQRRKDFAHDLTITFYLIRWMISSVSASNTSRRSLLLRRANLPIPV